MLQHLLFMQNKPTESERVGNEALALARAAGESEQFRAAIIMHRLALAKLRQGELAAAEKLARESVDLARQARGVDHVDTGWSFFALGRTLAEQGQSSDARACFEEALRIFRKHYPHDGNNVALVLAQLKKLETPQSPPNQKSDQ
jgi:tetratricopeptide (TPR) repeat protein